MWFWHIWGSVICLTVLTQPLASGSTREGVVFSLLIVPLWIGVVVTSLCKDFLAKPFSFCTPRHERAWRRTLFAIALVIACVCALVTLFTPSDTPGIAAVTVWQVFILSLAMFMVAVFGATATPAVSSLPALISALLIVVFNDNLADLRGSVGGALLASPFVTSVICTAVVFVSWRELGSRGFARKMSGQPFLGLHSTFNATRTAAYHAERKLSRMGRSPGTFMKSLERFFVSRMRAFSSHATLKSLWGALYIQIGKSVPATQSNFIALSVLLAAVAVGLGYYHPHRLAPGISGANLILFLVCTINAEYRINPYSGLLLNISRKNRLRSLLFSGLTQWLIVGLAAAALTVLSIAAGRFLDDLTIYGITYTYVPIHPKAFFVFAPMVPFYFLSQVLFPRHHVIAMIVIAIIGMTAFFTNGHKILEMSTLGILMLQVVSWLPFVAFIRHYCYAWDLKLNGQ
jgi:hypothetical protein